MPGTGYSQLPQQTQTPAAQVAGPTQGNSAGGGLRAQLLSGRERLDGKAEDYFAQGIRFQRGMRGELVKQVQAAINAGTDGVFGAQTEAQLKLFQKAQGLPDTGTVDQATWEKLKTAKKTKKLQGEEDFQRMWAAHPHNYMSDSSQNTSSAELIKELGLKDSDAPNTCALRMSTMFNRLGGGHELTVEKAKAAGLDKMRVGGLYMPKVNDKQSAGSDDRVLLSAKEMWTYIEKERGKPDLVFPPTGRYASEEEAKEGAKAVEAAIAGKKGFIAFDKIFGYGGSGHIDLFDGNTFSDGSLYTAQQTKIWFVVK
jgi:Type VI secretion system (T6SS), amidase effector protein 4/Putative peptidoglycan binding domain